MTSFESEIERLAEMEGLMTPRLTNPILDGAIGRLICRRKNTQLLCSSVIASHTELSKLTMDEQIAIAKKRFDYALNQLNSRL